MTTPLKALIQERLRAKIVRQGDDEVPGPSDAYVGSLPASLSNTTPLIDASEYMVPPPFTDSVTDPMGSRSYLNNHEEKSYHDEEDVEYYASELKFARRGPTHHREDIGYRQYDEYSLRPSRKAVAARQSSPVKEKRGKRSWREEDEGRHVAMDRQPTYQEDEPPMYSAKRARVVEKARHRQRSEDGYASVSPTRRKNYDLSGAYQRYREISSKRDQSRMPERQTSHHESLVPAWSEPPSREFFHPRRSYEDEYDGNGYAHDHAGRWKSPKRSARKSHGNYDPKEDSVPLSLPYHRRRGDVHPVGHVAPAHPTVASPTTINAKHRSFSPVTSRMHSNQFEYSGHIDASSDRLVFPAALQVPVMPRSPSVRFQRSSDSSGDSPPHHIGRFRAYDNVLSPESRQAAKDFVEKRQKRSTQGTPRTMATHRWLQSMMDARRNTSAIATIEVPQISSEENGDKCASYSSAFMESRLKNADRFSTTDASYSGSTDDHSAEVPPSPLQAPAFYSPRMYSSGCFFEAEI